METFLTLLCTILLGAIFGAATIYFGFLTWTFATAHQDEGYWMIICLPVILCIAFGFFTIDCAMFAGWWSVAIVTIDAALSVWAYKRLP